MELLPLGALFFPLRFDIATSSLKTILSSKNCCMNVFHLRTSIVDLQNLAGHMFFPKPVLT